MAASCWPYDPTSQTPPKSGIVWSDAAPGFKEAPLKVWRKISKHDAVTLSTDPRCVAVFDSLAPEIKEAVSAVASGRPEEKRKAEVKEPKAKPRTEKENLLEMLERVMEDAEQAEDLVARMRGIELRAKLHSLLTQRVSEDDRNVTINIVTGVNRE